MNISTGVVTLRWTDVALPGSSPLEFARNYSSTSARTRGILGYGWTFNLDSQVRWESDKLVWSHDGVERPIATSELLPPSATSNVTPQQVQAVHDGDELRITDLKQRTFVYRPLARGDRSWYLIVESDRNGNETRRRYDAQGSLVGVRDRRGREFELRYDAARRLVAVDLVMPDQSRQTMVRYEYNLQDDLVCVRDVYGHTLNFEYDQHLVVSYTNRTGGVRYYQYDDRRRCVATWMDDGVQLRRLDFDSTRRRTLVTDALGYRTLYEFNEAGLCIRRTDPTGVAKQTFYNDQGGLVATEDEEVGDGTLTVRDDDGRTVVLTDPNGGQWKYQLDDHDRPLSATDPAGGISTTEYDRHGNVTRVTSAGGRRWEYMWDQRGRMTQLRLPDGREVTSQYSDDGRTIRQSDQYGEVAKLEYDFFGRLARISGPGGLLAEWKYDLLGRVLTASYPGGNRQSFRYDAEGRCVEAVNTVGSRFEYRRDPWGNLLETIDPAGDRWALEYDRELRVRAIVNPRGERQEYVYDGAGRLLRIKKFDGVVESYTVDDQGYIVAIDRGPGDRVELTYDGLRRVVEAKADRGGVHTYEYDEVGRLIAASNRFGQVAFQYDVDGALVAEVQPGGTVSYEYDAMQRVVSVRLGKRQLVRSEYDLRGRPTRMEDFQGHVTTWEYPPAGNEVIQTTSLKVCQSRKLNPTGLTARHQVSAGAHPKVLEREYEYDAAQRLRLVRDTASGERFEYGYDSKDQVTQVARNGRVVERFRYDSTGNLLESHDFPACEYSAGDRLTKADGVAFDHDHRGNRARQIQNGATTNYHVGPLNELERVELPDGSIVEFEYDAMLRRTRKKVGDRTIDYVWSGWQLIQERDSQAGIIEYAYSALDGAPHAMAAGGEIYSFVNDHLRAPVMLLDGQGSVVWRRDASVFGAIAPESGAARVALRFPGQYADEETGLVYNRTRYFDPSTRRYLSQDLLGLAGGSNVYLYVGNDPVNHIDPFGLACFRQECEDAFQRMDNCINTQHNPPQPVNSPHPNPPNHKGLRQRHQEMLDNRGWMPMERLPGDPVAGGSGYANTVLSHIGEYWQVQDHLQAAQNDWWTNGCHPDNTSNPARAQQVAQDAEDWAHRPLPDNVPSGDPTLMRGIRMFRQDAGSGLWLPVV